MISVSLFHAYLGLYHSSDADHILLRSNHGQSEADRETSLRRRTNEKRSTQKGLGIRTLPQISHGHFRGTEGPTARIWGRPRRVSIFINHHT